MMVRPVGRLLFVSLATWCVSGAVADSPESASPAIPAEQAVFFEREIRPLLVRHCYECHRAGAPEVGGGLQLDSRSAVLRGGESGPALVPGDPAASRLIQAVRYTDPLLQMPPAGKLAEREIAALEEWVRRGAPDPRGESSTSPGSPRPVSDSQENAPREPWWSFRPLTDAGVPIVQDGSWPSSDVDRFVLRALEDQQMVPAPEAERRVLIRRVIYDL
ncbi:MAG: c-type cytochrome domain-containing protein, partial [Pirellulaceae bacterium]